MSRVRQLWKTVAEVIVGISLMVVPRSLVAGSSDIHPEQFRDGEFRVTRWAWVWPVVVMALGIFLLAPYARMGRGGWLVKVIGALAVLLGIAAGGLLRRLRVRFAAGKVTFHDGVEAQNVALAEVDTVYSTPGYINVLRRDGEHVEIPKLFARGALLLAMLREHRPEGGDVAGRISRD